MTEKADYGNWIRVRIVALFYLSAALMFGAAVLVGSGFGMALGVLVLVPFGMALYLTYAYIQFAPWGGRIQERLWGLLLEHLHAEEGGHALDIGTGNGALAVRLAKQYSELRVTGVDLWTPSWEYDRATAERNARAEGVADRVSFVEASAASLPFEDGAFEQVVSHFVFHEISTVEDKREVIREALRVLAPGGSFAFQDMFMDRDMYGTSESLLETIASWGVRQVSLVATNEAVHIPVLLRNRRALGHAAILSGRKQGPSRTRHRLKR